MKICLTFHILFLFQTTGVTKRGKSISAKVTAKVDTGRHKSGSTLLAPPMSSVVVERHEPIVKVQYFDQSVYSLTKSKP